jgi:hypothetical protein
MWIVVGKPQHVHSLLYEKLFVLKLIALRTYSYQTLAAVPFWTGFSCSTHTCTSLVHPSNPNLLLLLLILSQKIPAIAAARQLS